MKDTLLDFKDFELERIMCKTWYKLKGKTLKCNKPLFLHVATGHLFIYRLNNFNYYLFYLHYFYHEVKHVKIIFLNIFFCFHW